MQIATFFCGCQCKVKYFPAINETFSMFFLITFSIPIE